MNKGHKKLNNSQENVVSVSGDEIEVIREIIKSEKANLQVFKLPNKQEQVRYERLLKQLDEKFI